RADETKRRMKLQTPSSKSQRNSRHHAPLDERGSLGVCGLELLWKLKTFEHWSCARKRAVNRNPDLSDGMIKPEKSSRGCRTSASRPGGDNRASQRGGFFLLTPSPSPRERAKPGLAGAHSV